MTNVRSPTAERAIVFGNPEKRRYRLPHLVAELIATNVDVLITHGTPGTRVAKQATTTIPIVMAISGDAIATGLVSSLARPEANLTGSTSVSRLSRVQVELRPHSDGWVVH
jgi:ABC-type uncharacterized transport system substrate-binding protein